MKTKKCHNGMAGCGIEEIHRHEVGGMVTWTGTGPAAYSVPTATTVDCGSCRALRARVEELEKALGKIKDLVPRQMGREDIELEIMDIARRALEGEKRGETG